MKRLFLLLFITAFCQAEDYKEITRISYDSTATEYEENHTKISTEKKAESFLHYLTPPATLLDIGCGPGIDTHFFVAQGFEVTGIDISPKMIEIAKHNVPQAHFEVMDIEQIDFPKNSFDAIWASASLLHVPKDKLPAVLAQIKHIVKTGGIFYFSMKQGDEETLTPDERFGGVEKFWAYYQEDELLDYVKSVGFTVLEHTTYEKSTTYQTHPWISIICTKPY